MNIIERKVMLLFLISITIERLIHFMCLQVEYVLV